jgi:hypothetical protein
MSNGFIKIDFTEEYWSLPKQQYFNAVLLIQLQEWNS